MSIMSKIKHITRLECSIIVILSLGSTMSYSFAQSNKYIKETITFNASEYVVLDNGIKNQLDSVLYWPMYCDTLTTLERHVYMNRYKSYPYCHLYIQQGPDIDTYRLVFSVVPYKENQIGFFSLRDHIFFIRGDKPDYFVRTSNKMSFSYQITYLSSNLPIILQYTTTIGDKTYEGEDDTPCMEFVYPHHSKSFRIIEYTGSTQFEEKTIH